MEESGAGTLRQSSLMSMSMSIAIFSVAQIVKLLQSPQKRVLWEQKCHNKMWGKDLRKRNVLSCWRKIGNEGTPAQYGFAQAETITAGVNAHFSFCYGGNPKSRTLAALKLLLFMSKKNTRDFRHAGVGCEMHQKCASLTQDAWDLAGLNISPWYLTSDGLPGPSNVCYDWDSKLYMAKACVYFCHDAINVFSHWWLRWICYNYWHNMAHCDIIGSIADMPLDPVKHCTGRIGPQ